MRLQWKTLKKAFSDLNMGKTGWVSKEELKYYLNHWGFNPSAQDFDGLFRTLDHDKDGKISYVDF